MDGTGGLTLRFPWCIIWSPWSRKWFFLHPLVSQSRSSKKNIYPANIRISLKSPGSHGPLAKKTTSWMSTCELRRGITIGSTQSICWLGVIWGRYEEHCWGNVGVISEMVVPLIIIMCRTRMVVFCGLSEWCTPSRLLNYPLRLGIATFPCKTRGKSTNRSDQLPATPQVMISPENRFRNVCSLSVGPRNKRKNSHHWSLLVNKESHILHHTNPS